MSVCESQDRFNDAFEDAVKYVEKKQRPKLIVTMIVLIIFVVIFLWAIYLAAQTNPGQEKTLHLTLAMVFSPFYVISSYLN
jgi:hypothetical protein